MYLAEQVSSIFLATPCTWIIKTKVTLAPPLVFLGTLTKNTQDSRLAIQWSCICVCACILEYVSGLCVIICVCWSLKATFYCKSQHPVIKEAPPLLRIESHGRGSELDWHLPLPVGDPGSRCWKQSNEASPWATASPTFSCRGGTLPQCPALMAGDLYGESRCLDDYNSVHGKCKVQK